MKGHDLVCEAGVGRLLTQAELESWPRGKLRSAFSIGDGYVLTAWHCVSSAGGACAPLWLRLQGPCTPTTFVDVPVICHGHDQDLDAAILRLDEERTADPARLRQHLDDVALPLGTEVRAYDRVRIGGFPERNPNNSPTMLSGVVDSATATVGDRRAVRVHLRAGAARHPESPGGTSGGPLLRLGDDGERVVGLVHAYPVSKPGEGPLGGTVICRRTTDLRTVFAPVDAAIRHGEAPQPASVPGTEAPRLSGDVVGARRASLLAEGLGLPARWDLAHLEPMRVAYEADHPGVSRAGDTLTALCQGLRAKPAFLQVGGSAVELGALQTIYRRTVSHWPAGSSADALLVEAADADVLRARAGKSGTLGNLARFLIGVAAATGADLRDPPALLDLISELGHQIADADRHYRQCHDAEAWLLLDLGDEPASGAVLWPDEVSWIYLTRGADDVSGRVRCGRTEAGLRSALREILGLLPAGRLVVDIAAPVALLDQGVEHWQLLEVDGEFVPLATDHRPRLRWSRRRRDRVLQQRLEDRAFLADWENDPAPLTDAVLDDLERLRDWAREEKVCPWVVGATGPLRDPGRLRVLLREGCGFIVWVHAGVAPVHRIELCDAVAHVPGPARRAGIPDELPARTAAHRVVIWDDPAGRQGFDLPPLAAAEAV